MRHIKINTELVNTSVSWKNLFFIIFSIWIILISSCTSVKKLTYLKDLGVDSDSNYFPYNRPEYRLQLQDILYVKISTINDDINIYLNDGNSQSNQSMFQTESGAYLKGYTINDSGSITLPLIGDIVVLGMTLEEATNAIKLNVSTFINDPSIVVKLLSFKYTVIGEVKDPGSYYNYSRQVTVLDAIGNAGDFTDYGNRSNVLVIRSVNNTSETYRINLLKKDILSSEGFFIVPNDIVIVEPRRSKWIQLNAPTISFFITSIVSTVSLTILIISL
jgi:polysaccharide biosynthesis/export protein